MELIDWAEIYPHKTSREIAFIQSTVCRFCGDSKEIGEEMCNQCESDTCIKCGEEHDSRAGNLCKQCKPQNLIINY